MKLSFIILTGIICTILASCGYDNYDAPGSRFNGRLVYKGEPINVSFSDVTFQLWEPGWQKKAEINVTVDQDGSWSALLFNADYKLIIPSNQGPFRSKPNAESGSDTILVNIVGNKVLDIEVEPYYMLHSLNYAVAGAEVSGTFTVEQIISGANAKNIERVNLYVNKTRFVDFRSNVNKIFKPDEVDPSLLDGISVVAGSEITLKAIIDPPVTPTQNYVFARIGLKIQGVEDMIFSPIVKVNL